MAELSDEGFPTGDTQALGLPTKRVKVDVAEDQSSEPELAQQNADLAMDEERQKDRDIPEKKPVEAEEEKVEAQTSLLEKVSELEGQEEEAPVKEEDEKASLQREVRQLREQLNELVTSQKEKLSQATAVEETEEDEVGDFDINSPVIQDYLSNLRDSDPEEFKRQEAKLIELKAKAMIRDEISKVRAEFQTEKMSAANREKLEEAKAAANRGLQRALKSGDMERELVEQWENAPTESRKETYIGKALLRDPFAAMSEASMYRLVRGVAADLNDQLKKGRPIVETNETSGARARSPRRGPDLHQSDELSPEEQDKLEQDTFIDGLIRRNRPPEELAHLFNKE